MKILTSLFFTLAVLIVPLESAAVGLKFSWTDLSNNEDGFKVERSLTGATLSFSLIASPPANATSYDDVGLAENTSYTYRVQACNAAGCSAFSPTASGKTPLLIPATPGSPSVSPLP